MFEFSRGLDGKNLLEDSIFMNENIIYSKNIEFWMHFTAFVCMNLLWIVKISGKKPQSCTALKSPTLSWWNQHHFWTTVRQIWFYWEVRSDRFNAKNQTGLCYQLWSIFWPKISLQIQMIYKTTRKTGSFHTKQKQIKSHHITSLISFIDICMNINSSILDWIIQSELCRAAHHIWLKVSFILLSKCARCSKTRTLAAWWSWQ